MDLQGRAERLVKALLARRVNSSGELRRAARVPMGPAGAAPAGPKLRVLALHGYLQSATMFRSRAGALCVTLHADRREGGGGGGRRA